MKKLLFIAIVTIPALISCNKWNDYLTDYDFTGVYFAYQRPLRTVVAGEPTTFEMGVVMGGRRENTREEWVTFKVDPSLLEDESIMGDYEFTLMPESWYTMSNYTTMTIPKGDFSGRITVTLTEDFLKDAGSLSATYAIPLVITGTSVDSIMVGKYTELDGEKSYINPRMDYTIMVIKYISPYSGNYYKKGMQWKKVDDEWVANGNYIYRDLINQPVAVISTSAAKAVTTTYTGFVNTSSTETYGMKLTVKPDNSVLIEKTPNATAVAYIDASVGTWDPVSKIFNLTYEFVNYKNERYHVEEQLIWRDTQVKVAAWDGSITGGDTDDGSDDDGGGGGDTPDE